MQSVIVYAAIVYSAEKQKTKKGQDNSMDETCIAQLSLIERFATLPERLEHVLVGKSPMQLATRPSPGGWSAHDILIHLRAADDILSPHLLMGACPRDATVDRV